MSKISVFQINQTELALAIQQSSSGAAFSGNFTNYVASSGWMGNLVLSTTGGAQRVDGAKSFTSPIGVVYAGGTGDAVSRLYVDQNLAAISGAATGSSYQASVTYTNTVSGALQVLIDGVGGGSAPPGILYQSGNQLVTGVKTFIASPLVVAPTAPSGAANLAYVTGVSGALQTLISAGGGAGAPNSVTTTGSYVLAGTYVFSGSPLVASPTLPSGATNVLYVSGVSGAGVALNLATSGVLFARMTGISGVLASAGGGGVTNNFYITGTGTIANTFNASGNISNIFNTNDTTVITGDFVNLSFFFDRYGLTTGTDLVESMYGRSFLFTGYGLGVVNSGTQGFLSGSLYQRTLSNVKTRFLDFSLNSGNFSYVNGGLSQSITGLNRLGIDIYRIGTGITGLSVSLFGISF